MDTLEPHSQSSDTVLSQRPGTPTGRGSRLKIGPVRVQISLGALALNACFREGTGLAIRIVFTLGALGWRCDANDIDCSLSCIQAILHCKI